MSEFPPFVTLTLHKLIFRGVLSVVFTLIAASPVCVGAESDADTFPGGDMEVWQPVRLDASRPAPALPDGLPPGVAPHFFPKNSVEGENDFTHCTIARDTEIKHGDEASIRIETERGTDDLGISLTPMKVEPDTSYTV